MHEWEIMIDKITERKELAKTLRKYGLNATADEYLEMVGALKLYFLQQIDKAREKCASEFIEWIEGEGYNKWIDGKGYYAINDEGLEQLKAKYKVGE